jgi:hypothetical protein
MKVLVVVNGELKDAEIQYVGRPNFGFLNDWKECVRRVYIRQEKLAGFVKELAEKWLKAKEKYES